MTRRPAFAILALVLVGCASAGDRVTHAAAQPGRPVGAAINIDADHVVAIVGDSITEGVRLPVPAADSYAAQAAVMMCVDKSRCPSVQIDGHGGRCLVATICNGPNIVSGFAAEVLAVPSSSVLVAAGVNDLLIATDAQMESAYQDLAAESATAGKRFIAATITPLGAKAPYLGSTMDAQRTRVNTWLRATFGPGGNLADFDAALAAAGDTLNPAYDSGDGLHPNRAGATQLAEVVVSLDL